MVKKLINILCTQQGIELQMKAQRTGYIEWIELWCTFQRRQNIFFLGGLDKSSALNHRNLPFGHHETFRAKVPPLRAARRGGSKSEKQQERKF